MFLCAGNCNRRAACCCIDFLILRAVEFEPITDGFCWRDTKPEKVSESHFFPITAHLSKDVFYPQKNRMIFTVADFDSSSAVFEALLCHVERAADCSAMAVDPPSDFHGLVPEPAPCRASRASRARRRAVVPLDIDAHGKVMTRVKGQRTSEEPNKVPTRFFLINVNMDMIIWFF